MHTIKQIWRGMGNLPHVGEHPGTAFILVLPCLGLLAGGMIGFVIMSVVFLPIYIYGAIMRANLSDTWND